MLECVVCKDANPSAEGNILTCEHYHCSDCLKANARNALQTKPFVPAKCCSIIGKSVLVKADALTDWEMKRYEAKVEEIFTKGYKFYCHDTDCNEYIPTASQNRRSGTCLYCGRKTCKLCLSKSHWGPCNKERIIKDSGVADELVTKMAMSKNWKKCPSCETIVEKNGGCNHVNCRCGQEFCYACGKALLDLDRLNHVCSEINTGQGAHPGRVPNDQNAFF